MQADVRFIVFDWDGTLMDSEAQIVSCLHAAIADLRLDPMDDNTVKNVIGLGLREAVCTLYPGSDDAFVERYTEQYRVHWFAGGGESTLFPGARETVSLLREEGYLLAVATGKSRRGLQRAFDESGLEPLFQATRCADETFSKPHPQMLLEVMDLLGVEPAETLMIGDEVTVTVLGVKGNQVRIGVNAPRDVSVHREEIYDRIKRENGNSDD